MRCNYCGGAKLVSSKSRRSGDTFLKWFGIRPYRCNNCCKRMTKLNPAEASSVLVLCTLLAGTGFGLLYYRNQVESARFMLEMQVDPALQANQLRVDLRKTMQNEDVVGLVKAGASRDVIYKMISRSPAQFRVEANDIVELRRVGVPNDVISQMIEAMNNPGQVTAMVPTGAVAVPAKATVREFEATAQ
jgi:hypothetical protein